MVCKGCKVSAAHTHMQSSISSAQIKSEAWWHVSDSRDRQVERGKALVFSGQQA